MLCRKLKGVMNKFWWSNNKSLKGIHWSNWDALCKPKNANGLGFKNLVWRLLSQPNCLLAKKSICSVRDLIDEGILWRIGNGASIKIWNDPWLPRAGNNRISAQQINPNWTTVNQLIESETNTWNKDLIYNIVDEDHAARIFSIPLSEANSEDMLVWKHEGTGEYSVKSRYRVLVTELLHNSTYTSSNVEAYKDFYISFWSLNIPTKIKIHLWRLSLKVEVNCPICKVAPEDSDHLLWSCGILQQIWASLKIKIAPDDGFSSCKSRFVNSFSVADNHNRQLIAISIWALWYRRNKLIYEGVKFSLQELLGFIRGYGHEICLSQENLRVFYRSPETERWNTPEIGFIKINFDATFKVDSRTSTTVVLARDSKGEVVGAETYLFEDVVDAFVAEARACERAILFVIKMGF
ncbi:hypothetical protein V6Z11_A10G229500 [Gossypium hirsutum]